MNAVNSAMLSFERIESLLASLKSALGAAESHGLLCGLLCAQTTQRAKAQWFSELLDSAGVQSGEIQSHAQTFQQLDSLFEQSVVGINDTEFAFELLLPNDESSIADRISALAAWCDGFCAGVGFGVTAERNLPEDTQVLLRDFGQIANADPDNAEDQEDMLTELQEYVRVGVLLINEELQPATDAGNSIH